MRQAGELLALNSEQVNRARMEHEARKSNATGEMLAGNLDTTSQLKCREQARRSSAKGAPSAAPEAILPRVPMVDVSNGMAGMHHTYIRGCYSWYGYASNSVDGQHGTRRRSYVRERICWNCESNRRDHAGGVFFSGTQHVRRMAQTWDAQRGQGLAKAQPCV